MQVSALDDDGGDAALGLCGGMVLLLMVVVGGER